MTGNIEKVDYDAEAKEWTITFDDGDQNKIKYQKYQSMRLLSDFLHDVLITDDMAYFTKRYFCLPYIYMKDGVAELSKDNKITITDKGKESLVYLNYILKKLKTAEKEKEEY